MKRSKLSGRGRSLLLCVLLTACSLAHDAPQAGTETGNPSSIDARLISLMTTDGMLHVVGLAGSVLPGGSRFSVRALSGGTVLEVRSNPDGSFDVPVAAADKLDTFELRTEGSAVAYVTRGGPALAQSADSLTCEQRSSLARAQLAATAELVDRRCTRHEDCVAVHSGSVCNDSCDRFPASRVGQGEQLAARNAVESGLCAAFESDGCMRLLLPCTPPSGSLRCQNQSCAIVEPAANESCAATPACLVEEANGILNTRTQQLDALCLRELFPEKPSAGLYEVCLVDAQGALLLTTLTGSRVPEYPSFTHSAYGGGNIPSTLSPTDEQRCTRAKAELPNDRFRGQCE